MDAMLRVLTYNIQEGGCQREALIQAVIRAVQPDVVLLQELTNEHLFAACARDLHARWFFAPGRSRYHLGLISRYPLLDARSVQPFPMWRTLVEATVQLPSARRLKVWGVHLVPHLTLPTELWRLAEVRALLRRAVGRQRDLCLIEGDCNAIAPEDRVLIHALPPLLKGLLLAQGGRVFHFALRELLRAGWIDCYRRRHPVQPGWTIPSSRPNARLDYVFANQTLATYLHDCTVLTHPAVVEHASDHLPVLATFVLS